MASKAQLLLPSVKIPQTSSVSSMLASTNQVLSNLNTQLQQISSAFTLNKPVTTPNGSTGGITVGNITMGSNNFIRAGSTGYNAGTGFWMGYDTSPTAGYKFFIGSASGNKLLWDGSTLSITGSITATTGTIGGWSIGPDYIQDTAGLVGLSSAVTAGDDIRFWAGNAVKASAPFKVTEAGALTASSGTVGGFTLSATNLSAGTTGTYINLSSTGSIVFGVGATTAKTTITSSSVSITGFTNNPIALMTWLAGESGKLELYKASSVKTIDLNGTTGLIVTSGNIQTARYICDLNGTVSAPSFCFNTSPTTGLYLSGANIINVTANSTDIASFSTVEIVAGKPIRGVNGTLAAPTYAFTSDPDTGWRWNSSGDMRAVSNAADVLVVRSAAIVCLQPLKLANNFVAGAPAATGYVTVQDLSGTTYKLLAAP